MFKQDGFCLLLMFSAFLLFVVRVDAQTSTPEANSTPHVSIIHPYTIAGLQEREYLEGIIQIRSTEYVGSDFIRYYIDFPSDDLTITGVMNVPMGEGPFPVVILLHGYYDRATYWSGLGTWQEAEYLARNGYLTIALDFRTWGTSDHGANLFATGLVIDTLNLISSLSSIPEADTTQIGIWGHSMGGGVATKALVVDPRIQAGVLYAPNSANDADLIERWGPACLSGQSQAAGDMCNPAEVLPSELSDEIVDAYFAVAYDPIIMQQIAPIYHVDQITAPIQIHIGTDDGATLVQTPPEWSENLYLALNDANRDVEYFVYANQGHFLTGQSWSLMMQRTVAFFDINLGE